MTCSDKWLRFRESEDNFFTCRYDFVQNKEEMVKDLKMALANANDRETALRLLRDIKPTAEIITPLLSELVDTAIDSSNLTAIELARDILINYKSEPSVESNVRIFALSYLPENDEWNYRRIAELYELLSYKEELENFIALCQANDNPEIPEIGDDFKHRQN